MTMPTLPTPLLAMYSGNESGIPIITQGFTNDQIREYGEACAAAERER